MGLPLLLEATRHCTCLDYGRPRSQTLTGGTGVAALPGVRIHRDALACRRCP